MADLEVSVAADKNRPAATTLSDKQWRARRRRQLDDLQARRERTSGAAIPTANEVNSTPVIKGWCVCNNPTRLMEAANRWKMARMAKEIAEGTLTLVTRTAEAQVLFRESESRKMKGRLMVFQWEEAPIVLVGLRENFGRGMRQDSLFYCHGKEKHLTIVSYRLTDSYW